MCHVGCNVINTGMLVWNGHGSAFRLAFLDVLTYVQDICPEIG